MWKKEKQKLRGHGVGGNGGSRRKEKKKVQKEGERWKEEKERKLKEGIIWDLSCANVGWSSDDSNDGDDLWNFPFSLLWDFTFYYLIGQKSLNLLPITQ